MSAPRTDHTHVLLLRGVNVGRANRVSKDTLVDWAERAGATAPSTHLASGNVLFRVADGTDGAGGDAAAAAVRDRFAALARDEGGLAVPVVVASAPELRAALAVLADLGWAGPGGAEVEPRLTQLTVLEREPEARAAERLAALDHGAGRPEGADRSALTGRLLWTFSPAGVAASPLTSARLDRALGVAGTARNLTTVRVLAGVA